VPVSKPDARFATTRWSLVLEASRADLPDSNPALEEICRLYWSPLYAFVRRAGQSPEDAEDLTQAFFSSLLEKQWLSAADPEKGRLRTFLITAMKHFMAKEWRRASAQKRGGGQAVTWFDTPTAERRYAAVPESAIEPEPERMFDRQWALLILDLTLARLESEYLGREAVFAILKQGLTGDQARIDYAVVAERLELGEGAARVAMHRLRKRFREIYREEVGATLPAGAEIDDEIRHLARCLMM
jgi:RNA polymerase sigma-70 factor (ECF subfamily)